MMNNARYCVLIQHAADITACYWKIIQEGLAVASIARDVV